MKVSGPSGLGSTTAPRGAGRAVADGFFLSESSAGHEAAPAARLAGPSGVASIDALLALQEVGGPIERRRRAVKRAGRILDVLDGVKVALLDGEVPAEALAQLMVAVRQERDQTEDPELEGLLDEIETRAEVEMAKLELARRAA
jgi:hypothetical protein